MDELIQGIPGNENTVIGGDMNMYVDSGREDMSELM